MKTEQAAVLATDQQIGKYRLVELLGKGTSGAVYRALDTFSGKHVALKIIDPKVFRDPEFGVERHAQFLSEASLAGMLIHPHVVSILDAVVQRDTGHIAMELITGGDLSQHTQPSSLLPVPDVIEIAFNCCSALEYTSRVGIIHCDIKPANIMIAEGTDVRITDFGSAFLQKSKVVRTAAMGSPHYMSPEQIAGKQLTLQSDMYSLGVVIYQLLTGQLPFAPDHLDDLVKKILTEEPIPPSRVRPGLSRAFDQVVLRALNKNPERRYENWSEFSLELSELSRRALAPEPIPDSEKLDALNRVEAFAPLSEMELWEIAKVARWTRVNAHDAILRENDTGAHFFFLATGSAKVMRRKRLLNVIHQGEFFGEMAYLMGGKQSRQATVIATKALLVAEFSPQALTRISLGAQLQLTRALARNLVERLSLANTRLTS
ncbi:MAG: serine/threonine-protein kinase [Burkholderiales bacterium]